MKRIALAFAALVLACVAVAAGAPHPPMPGSHLVVVTDDNYPPYLSRAEDGSLQGYVKDKWDLWSRQTGVRVELRGMRWADAQRAVIAGDADVIDLLADTPGRAGTFEFSRDNEPVEARLFFQGQLAGTYNTKNLRGLLVGAKDGGACVDWLHDKGVDAVRTYPDSPALVAAAARGEVRVFCMDAPVANYLMFRQGVADDFRESAPLYSTSLHWAVPRGHDSLAQFVQRGFDAVPRVESERIEAKWLGRPLRTPLDIRILYALAIVPIALLTLSGALGIWNRCLRRRLATRAQYFKTRDPLTGLPARTLLHDRLARAIADSGRAGTVVAVLFVDLDRFKAVNDAHGHDRGDRVLKEAATRLQRCVRESDTVARISSDEFVVVLGALRRPDEASMVARNVLSAMEQPFDLGGEPVYCTASIGIAIHPGDGASAETLIRNADIAMYRAKKHGRNGFQYFLPEMHDQAVRRIQLETALRGALERGEFQVHYQPRVSVADGQVTGFEALLRWQHPQFGLLPPSEFVPVLEDTGVIVAVGEWVIGTVCREIAQWRAMSLPLRPIAVNLSARQFRTPGLDRTINAIIAESGIDPALLELELTESLLMHDPEAAVATLRNLERAGVRLAIDDFGTGYSSLMYLKRFPIDALKIDRAFISDATSNPEDAAISLAIIQLGHSLGLRVVAEGVETVAQLEFLRRAGCDEMQGFLFSRALPAAAARAMLPAGRPAAAA